MSYFDADVVEALHQSGFGLVPGFVLADAHFRTGRDLVGDFREAEVLVDLLHETRVVFAFLENLIFRAEDVAVVLREGANAHHAVQRAGRFVAVALTEFAVAKRQIAVGAK